MGLRRDVCILRQGRPGYMIAIQETAMTQSLMSQDKAEAKKKGLFALSAWAGAGVLFVYLLCVFSCLRPRSAAVSLRRAGGFCSGPGVAWSGGGGGGRPALVPAH